MKVLLVHGWGGSDYPHWQSWLASELAKDYGTVSFFKFSDVDSPKIDEWESELLEHLEDFRPDVVVCHSLANTLWFHLCNKEKIKKAVKKLYLVAPPSMNCDIAELKSFFPLKTPANIFADKAILVTSTNDPYMEMDEAEKLQEELDIKMHVLKDAGHINADSGFGEWPWILEDIKSGE